MKNKQGLTLLEMVIYMFLLVLILGLVYRIIAVNQRQMERPAANFRLQQDMIRLEPLLRKDLEETCLNSVQVYPNEDQPDSKPGLILSSAKRADNTNIVISSNGTPYWQRVISYCILPDNNDWGTGKLVRFTSSSDGYSTIIDYITGKISNPPFSNVDANNIVCPNVMLPDQEIPEQGIKLEKNGGFKVEFMNANGEVSSKDIQRHTIVAVTLYVKEVSRSTGKPTIMQYQIRVCPRY